MNYTHPISPRILFSAIYKRDFFVVLHDPLFITLMHLNNAYLRFSDLLMRAIDLQQPHLKFYLQKTKKMRISFRLLFRVTGKHLYLYQWGVNYLKANKCYQNITKRSQCGIITQIIIALNI